MVVVLPVYETLWDTDFSMFYEVIQRRSNSETFSFWSYEWSKQALSSPEDTDRQTAMKVLLCGGLAGVVTWASIFPMGMLRVDCRACMLADKPETDVVKTRVQTQSLNDQSLVNIGEHHRLLGNESEAPGGKRRRLGTFEIAKLAYQNEGIGVFFRGLGVCSVRAFVVNAVQWAVYEWMMQLLRQP